MEMDTMVSDDVSFVARCIYGSSVTFQQCFFNIPRAVACPHERDSVIRPPHAAREKVQKGDWKRQIPRSSRRRATTFEDYDLHILYPTYPYVNHQRLCFISESSQ